MLVLLRQAGSSHVNQHRIAAVMAVHRPDPGLLRQSLAILLFQVGVCVQPALRLDGPKGGLGGGGERAVGAGGVRRSPSRLWAATVFCLLWLLASHGFLVLLRFSEDSEY
jgi:hypothetical protein